MSASLKESIVARTETTERSRWMELLGQHVASKTLSELVLPGAHDAATAEITSQSPWGPDKDGFLGKLPSWLVKIGGDALKAAVCDWSRAQRLTLGALLRSGIRYLDLRVGKGDDHELRFTHTLMSGRVSDGLAEVADFLGSHPKEIVILDFQHFYDMTGADHDDLNATLDKHFASSFILPSTPFPRIDSLWANQTQVVVLYCNECGGQQVVAKHPKLWARETHIRSNWCEAADIGILHACLSKEVSQHPTAAPDKFFVLQGVITPDVGTIADGFLNGKTRSLKDLAEQHNATIVGWFADEWPRNALNILMVDWIEAGDVAGHAIDLNQQS